MEMVDIEKIRLQLLDRIDSDDLVEVKKVERYCELLKLDQKCNEAIENDGASIIIENGTQRFIKSHPSMNDKTKINAQLIALERTFNFVNEVLAPAPTAASVEGEQKFTKDDLI